jgi:hypothetical protein
METPTLIYCASGNKRMAQIAIDAGFKYGAQLPHKIYHEPYFVDQNWKKPNREKYMVALEKHKPYMATVLDWERQEQLSEVLNWAEEAAEFVEVVVIIPKVIGGISQLPRSVGRATVRLGYSVPTRYGGTELPAWEFYGWPVHLLGGSPHAQMRLARYLNVVSADGNMHHLMATKRCQFWTPGNVKYASNRWWPTLKEFNGGERWGDGSNKTDAPYVAFEMSCKNIMEAWQTL